MRNPGGSEKTRQTDRLLNEMWRSKFQLANLRDFYSSQFYFSCAKKGRHLGKGSQSTSLYMALLTHCLPVSSILINFQFFSCVCFALNTTIEGLPLKSSTKAIRNLHLIFASQYWSLWQKLEPWQLVKSYILLYHNLRVKSAINVKRPNNGSKQQKKRCTKPSRSISDIQYQWYNQVINFPWAARKISYCLL